MKCKNILDLLPFYILDDLETQDREIVASHIENCEECRSRFEKLKIKMNIIKKMDNYPEPDEQYWEKFDGKLKERLSFENIRAEIPVKKKELLNWKTSSYIAAAAVFLIAIFFGWQNNFFSPLKQRILDKDSSGPISVIASRSEKYLSDAKKIIINVLYSEANEDSVIDISIEKEYAAKLLKESREIRQSLPIKRREELDMLVSDLETVLLQIAHLEAQEDAPEVEIVKDGIRKNSILMKINLHQLNNIMKKKQEKVNDGVNKST